MALRPWLVQIGLLVLFLLLTRTDGKPRGKRKATSTSRSLIVHPKTGSVPVALKLVSPVRVTSIEALKAEIVAAELALSLRAEVDGAAVTYDSPSISISLRKVSSRALVENGTKLEAPDGSGVEIPADPRVKGKYGGPVTVTLTSFHAGDVMKGKETPTIKFGANRRIRRVGGPDSISGTEQKEDRVDFMMTKTSVSWRGTVNVKVPGLNAQVPAHERPWTPYGTGEVKFPAEKEQVLREMQSLASLPDAGQQLRGYRRLARQWHPDKRSAEEQEMATDVFAYLQELRVSLLGVGPVQTEQSGSTAAA